MPLLSEKLKNSPLTAVHTWGEHERLGSLIPEKLQGKVEHKESLGYVRRFAADLQAFSPS